MPVYYEVVEGKTGAKVKKISERKFPTPAERKNAVYFAPDGSEKQTILELGLFHWLAHRREPGCRTVCMVNDDRSIDGWHLQKK